MKLNDLRESKVKKTATRALKENFNYDLKLDRLNFGTTRQMLSQVRGLLKEYRQSSNTFHSSHRSPGYLKLVMMEQALSDHYRDLYVERQVVLENEEVEKSQVILAAQDMVDTVQKMIEQVSKMNAEELPAVVTGVENEIGANEGEQFMSSSSAALTELLANLAKAKGALSQALGIVTGQGAGASADMGAEAPEADMGAEAPETDMSIESPPEPEMGAEEPEEEPEEMGGAGRELR